jgi:hypothetical protein
MKRAPQEGDTYVLTRAIPGSNFQHYHIGTTITLLQDIKTSTLVGCDDGWKCLDEMGITEWFWVSWRIQVGDFVLLCKSSGIGVQRNSQHQQHQHQQKGKGVATSASL